MITPRVLDRRAADPEAVLRFTRLAAGRATAPYQRLGLHEANCAGWLHPVAQLKVIESVTVYGTGFWHHVSVSRRGRLPSWEDLKSVREIFIGLDVECYMVFPPTGRWVNIHAYCLHLWRCLDAPDGAVLPDFRTLGMI